MTLGDPMCARCGITIFFCQCRSQEEAPYTLPEMPEVKNLNVLCNWPGCEQHASVDIGVMRYCADHAAQQKADLVKHPAHYTAGKIEVWDFINDQGLSFIEGNVLKYVCRHKTKNGLQDLLKARQYLEKLILLAGGTPNTEF